MHVEAGIFFTIGSFWNHFWPQMKVESAVLPVLTVVLYSKATLNDATRIYVVFIYTYVRVR